MRKLSFLLITAIVLGAMLTVIPIGLVTPVAKASTCSLSVSSGSGLQVSVGGTFSGSCSFGGATSQSQSTGVTAGIGGFKSGCTSTSATSHTASHIAAAGGENSAVSCSSHSP